MSLIFYNLTVFAYRLGISLVSPFNKKAQQFLAGRKGIFEKLAGSFRDNDDPVAWFHCASLGEFEQGRPVIEAFKRRFPEYKILLTFFSPSGYEVRKNYAEADYIYYLPVDSRRNARRFVKTVKPSIAFFVKYEFWHHYSKELNKNEIPLLSISTIFRPDQLFFKSYGNFYRNILKHFNYFFLQDQRSADLLSNVGIKNFVVSGDTRFDRVAHICNNQKALPLIEQFKNGQRLMVVGSAWPEDMAVLAPFINQGQLKFIIAPHEMDEKFLDQMKSDFIRKTVRYSQLPDKTPSEYDILIIDNVGMLSSLYKYGEFAFIGGGFGKGLHNILEAATFGVPIFFGNHNYIKFREAVDLINLGGAVAIAGHDELRVQFNSFTDDKTYEIASQINADYVKNNTGATGKIMDYTEKLLN